MYWRKFHQDYGCPLPNDLSDLAIAKELLPYIHFGEYRQTSLPLAIQKAMYEGSVENLQEMAAWYKKQKCQTIVIEGNIDAGYFRSFPQEIVGRGQNTRNILTPAVNRYCDDFTMLNLKDCLLVALPFYPLIENDVVKQTRFVHGLQLLQSHFPHKPVIIAMHGLACQGHHSQTHDNTVHIQAFSSFIRKTAEAHIRIDYIVYGHDRRGIPDSYNSYSSDFVFIPTHYVSKDEVFPLRH